MATMKSSGDLIASIQSELADNNGGLISAEDIRSNLEDTAFSINRIVSSGDTDQKYPFFTDVRLRQVSGTGGTLIPESGIVFPNSLTDAVSRQVDPWLGPGSIQHDDLAGRDSSNDAHAQYLSIDGTRAMTENLPMAGNWINSSGATYDDRGMKYRYEGDHDDIYIGMSGNLIFNKDTSSINSFHGVAKAWLSFDASGVGNVPVIRSYHNIDSVQRLEEGKLKITFTSGIFMDNDYVAIGNSNSTTSSGSMEDFDVNTVGLVLREGDDAAALRSITYVIRNDAGQYVDAHMNDFVAYGYEPGSTSGTTPTVIGL